MLRVERIWFCAFETAEQVKTVKDIDLEAETVEGALEEVFRRFNHAIPGETGDLAERHGTRSLSVDDVVKIDGQFFLCAPAGWRKIDSLDEMLRRCHRNRTETGGGPR